MATLIGTRRMLGVAATLLVLGVQVAGAAPLPEESPRMARAKDLIADEHWGRAIQELRVAADDSKEPNRDEALFWLAHSQNQTMDLAPAVETIRRLERQYPSSRWVKPARSLLIELAQKLQRNDFLWWTAASRGARPQALEPATPPEADGAQQARPRMRITRPLPSRSNAPATRAPEGSGATAGTPPKLPTAWVFETYWPDTDLRIQALGSLIYSDADKAIPMLREIALETDNPGAARRAVIVLAQSRKAEAQTTVIEMAKTGPEFVRLAAVRELGRFGGANVSQELLAVYSTSNAPVKHAVVRSLGLRSATAALLKIAESESDRDLRQGAIVALGRAGGREQLRTLYRKVSPDMKASVIVGLFNARADEDLIRIAETEKEAGLRTEAVSRLRLLGTPRAQAFLATQQ